ncbi:MAG: DUF1080 domain-containing protein [Planctomycetaceae bacterium]|nr:DUF1080 domain-containing protein [Planctomycetaceae bacterium]
MMSRSVIALLLTVLGTSSVPADELGFIDLFNGRDLDGWTQRNGTATYRVEGDTIVGKTTEGSPNSFLCTDELYGDFELKFDVKVDSELNSGVQIRSQSVGDVPEGRVNGPQVEISLDGMAAYVYGEAAGGWMTPDEDRKPHDYFKDGEWNSYHIVAFGNRIETWLNGHPVSDLVHEERYESHPKGFIGLQVHGIGSGKGPFEVRWRNLKLRDLSKFKPLYNGKDLTAWKTTGNWIPQEDGSLLIEPRDGEKGWERFDAYLWSEKKYRDFVLDVEYAYPPGGNSGVYFRVGDRDDPVKQGIEAQILDCSEHEGKLGPHDHGGIIGTAAPSANMSMPPNEWNRMVVTCIGPHLQVELNGTQIIDTMLDQGAMKDRPREGYIGFQDHGQPNNLKFRNIRLRELTP